MITAAAHAQLISGPADVGRIQPEKKLLTPDPGKDREVSLPKPPPATPIPDTAQSIHFILSAVHIEGATAFTQSQLSDIYAPSINKEITLTAAYAMAGQITERYRNAGYFLSLAYIPNQSIEGGAVTIRVVEGYIAEIALPKDIAGHEVIKQYISRLIAQKPVKSDAVERFLLQMNDVPGYAFRSVLSQVASGEEGAEKLTLQATKKDDTGHIRFDNFSSRYLGPNEITTSYSAGLLPLQQTTISGLTSLPMDKLRYGALGHTVVIAPDITLEFNGNVTKAYPGYTLGYLDIDSKATALSLGIDYQWIRQRQENLVVNVALGSRDVVSDFLHIPLTRDHIRSLQAGMTYDTSDRWHGYNVANAAISRGIAGLGASQKGELNISRADAAPDFTKTELSLSRLQALTQDWSLLASAHGQLASGVLYSSEQFGYGGQDFGRAYDASDITGDHGIAGALELRYGGWGTLQPISLQPHIFYDVGTVWNEGIGAPKRASGASAGFGVNFTTDWRQTGSIGLAWPLTRDIAAPIYGKAQRAPRILLQISQEF